MLAVCPSDPQTRRLDHTVLWQVVDQARVEHVAVGNRWLIYHHRSHDIRSELQATLHFVRFFRASRKTSTTGLLLRLAPEDRFARSCC